MAQTIDPVRRDAWRAFLEAHSSVTGALEAELEAARGLPLAWYDVLAQLSDAKGGKMRMQELARAVLLSKSGLTRLFDRMEREGLVRREPCADDARGTFAVLTPSGRARLRDAAPVYRRAVRRHFGELLTDTEARVLRDALGKLVTPPRS